jgi:hypothetical protein
LSTTINVVHVVAGSKFVTAGIDIATERAPDESTVLDETTGAGMVARSTTASRAGVGAGVLDTGVEMTVFEMTVSVFVSVSNITVLTVTF